MPRRLVNSLRMRYVFSKQLLIGNEMEMSKRMTEITEAVKQGDAGRILGLPKTIGWPAACISDEQAKLAFQLATLDLEPSQSTPSLIVDGDGAIVAQVMERNVEGFNDKDRLAEMWARARLLAHAPKMYEALRLIACQSPGSDYPAEEAVAFMREFAREVMAEARGIKVSAPAELGAR